MRRKKPEGDRSDWFIRGIIAATILVSAAALGLVVLIYLGFLR